MHAQSDSREKVVEAYTFTIKYDLTGEAGKRLVGVEMNSQEIVPRTVEATISGLQVLLREVMESCKTLPDLPGGSLPFIMSGHR